MAAVSSKMGSNRSNGQVPACGIDRTRIRLYVHPSAAIKPDRAEVDSASSRPLWMEVRDRSLTMKVRVIDVKARIYRLAAAITTLAVLAEGLGARRKW
jgi:hypothetical protein